MDVRTEFRLVILEQDEAYSSVTSPPVVMRANGCCDWDRQGFRLWQLTTMCCESRVSLCLQGCDQLLTSRSTGGMHITKSVTR